MLSKDGKPCFPKSDEIFVETNTYQVRKQLESVSTLKLMPLKEHRNLIRLFEDREKTKWKQPKKNEIDKWIVLTDDTRDGCKEQRTFVNQALNTPDFAILEGPPGSGKTTVILELICQLVQKR
ncbi:AAA domain-containing protein [Capnocytophaga canimorsus]|nr:AAA domain-containing protein [Capnocytophaga canimorsus]WGU67590.1 AAA domain-containing protein [Capnocytophaga canimorsus]